MATKCEKTITMSFLSKPPPPQKAPPGIPLPPPPSLSPAYSSIITWATLVQPGSPAPRSPPSRRPSISISHAGHTPVFVHFPTSPSPYPRQRSTTAVEISKPPSPKSTAYAHIPIPPMPSEEPPVKRTGLSRLRSLSILKPKKQPSSPPSVAASAPKSKPTKSKKNLAPPTESCSPTIAKRKYLIPPPPSLANDLALARRRPAPLKLAHQSQNAVVVRRPGQVKTPATTTLESVVEKVRKKFLADSFAPIPATTKIKTNTVRAAPAPPPGIMNKKPSRMNMRGLFGRKAN